MFTVQCPRHATSVLLGAGHIEALTNTADGVVLHWRCQCGARGTQRCGRPAPHARLAS